ncbi:MAG: BlaI/MecI/CopY family transcriptional regulator [Vallitaleaceae bacterium]|nr:BlaI/MecI/CopY family transcriptional regulator [Vallitaleaceae bacterium]
MMKIPSVSEAEWVVMKVIWEANPITAKQIIQKLEGEKDWKEKTIKTMLSRLVSKEALSFEKDGREFNYYPLITEKECMEAENDSFIKKVYNGKLNIMLANFLQQEDLSEEEIEELRKILDSKR